ncbi:MAG: hypothetical protein WBE61_12245 [Nitrososphaeraceae archaeon]
MLTCWVYSTSIHLANHTYIPDRLTTVMLADGKDAASAVAHVIADSFDKLYEDFRNELLLKLADVHAGYVYE